MQLTAGARGAINGMMGEVIEDHILHHLAAEGLTQQERNEGAAELTEVVRAYLK
jgi:DNA-binding FrmR family transcriptional regulator